MSEVKKRCYRVIIGGVEKQYPEGTKYMDIAKEYEPYEKDDIVLVKINNKLQELHKRLNDCCELEFVTTGTSIGMKTYKRSATHVLLKAIYDVAGGENIEQVRILFSVGSGYFCMMRGKTKLDQQFLDLVKKRMEEIVAEKLPIKKRSIHTDEAVKLFKKHRMYDKEQLFRYRRVSKVNVYSIKEFEDYYYGYMVPDTGYIKCFDLNTYQDGFIIQLPDEKEPTLLPPFQPREKLFQVQRESVNWGDMLNIDTVGALNTKVAAGNINELILVQEALQEQKIAEIARAIHSQPDKKIIMIAGPSSSGKTTFSHRLSVQLLAFGLKPHPIAVDDYFINRESAPIDEHGKYDFECLEALDVEQFNKDMKDLLHGKKVELPTYNFKTGRREYKGKFKQLGEQDILVLEGIHCLNDQLSYSLPAENKYKIYISALTQLNIDEHNRIPSTDGRLLRRIVRDARTRGTSAKNTIRMWYSVRRGEENNIFPFQEQADVMFNSALIYELAVLKQYVEPVLFGIEKEEPEYLEAKRLLTFLDYFIGIRSEDIPKNSILREFIGESCFHV